MYMYMYANAKQYIYIYRYVDTYYFLHAKKDDGGLFFSQKLDKYTLNDKIELLTHECGGVDTILTSVR